MQVDERLRAAVARLTDNERECLRRRLLPQTAKEMALDLGISPHAVEKRLKMARAKLGLSSSLEAARLLSAVEGYGELGPQPADLAEADEPAATRSGAQGRALAGALLMLLIALIAALPQASAPVPAPAGQGTMRDEHGRPVATRKVGMDEAAASIAETFQLTDLDHSGFFEETEIDRIEATGAQRDRALPPAPAAGQPDLAARRKWLGKMDQDRDGRISLDEYTQYMMPWILWQGVPADWHPRR